MMKYLLLFIFIISSAAASYSQSKELFKQLNKLEGLWKMETPDGSMYEEWKIASNNLLIAKSYKVKGTDTALLENVQLALKKKVITYNVTVAGQHNGQAVSFKLINTANNTFTFENKGNDFPQRILYKIKSTDSLHARIEGINKGKQMFVDFNFKKVR